MRFEGKSSLILLSVAIFCHVVSSSPISNEPKFYYDLFKEISSTYGSKSLVYSPFSVQTCLTMASFGAAGKTATDLQKSLVFVGQTTESVAESFHSILAKYENSKYLNIANKFYVMDGYKVKQQFNEILSNKFFSSAENIDFQQSEKSTEIINNWVKSKTDNAISDLVKPGVITGDTRLFLLSAIHFKGSWEKPFAAEATKEGDFYTDETHAVKLPLMYKEESVLFGWYQDLEASAIRLPYADSDLSMVIVLPHKRSGLSAVLQKLEKMSYNTFLQNMKKSSRSIHIVVPKFKAELDVELNDVLKRMGMESMFDGADFSNMLDTTENIKIRTVLHKAVIEVNEEGTKASAATGMEGMYFSMPQVFRANHPFYYAIINEDLIPLFEGTFIGV